MRGNRISGLEDINGVWQNGEDQVAGIAGGYFQELFSTSQPHRVMEVLDCVEARVSNDDNESLVRPFTYGRGD
ncbi:hypothetical protein ACFX15_014082 [Malus domestica]